MLPFHFYYIFETSFSFMHLRYRDRYHTILLVSTTTSAKYQHLVANMLKLIQVITNLILNLVIFLLIKISFYRIITILTFGRNSNTFYQMIN
jgi:hypothetical protein